MTFIGSLQINNKKNSGCPFFGPFAIIFFFRKHFYISAAKAIEAIEAIGEFETF